MAKTRRKVLLTGIMAATTLVTAGWATGAMLRPATTWNPENLVGTKLPVVTLTTVDGSRRSLADVGGGRPLLLVLADTKDCLSCANPGFELRVVASHVPSLATLLVGSGPGADVFRAYFRASHLREHGLLDSSGSLLRALGKPTPPLALLVAADGTILLTDARQNSTAAQYPLGRRLTALAEALTANDTVLSVQP